MFEKLKAVIEESLSVEGTEITENTDFKLNLKHNIIKFSVIN